MNPKNLRVFLDTSVLFAAVLSPTGGARMIFRLGEIGLIKLVIGPSVLREADEVVRRKIPASLPGLAHLLAVGRVEVGEPALAEYLKQATNYVHYSPDARVLAEALRAAPDWFITHDQEHFLKEKGLECLPFKVGTPGDVLQYLRYNLG